MLKAQLAQMQREEQQLRSQEIELSSQLTTEQGRWQDFNSRLDELEGQLPVLRR
jgi:chromosome segregation ATPase